MARLRAFSGLRNPERFIVICVSGCNPLQPQCHRVLSVSYSSFTSPILTYRTVMMDSFKAPISEFFVLNLVQKIIVERRIAVVKSR